MKQPRKAPKAKAAPKPNVTPQQQAQYDTVMLAARRNIYGDPNDDSRFKFVLQRLAAAKGNVGGAIGQITAVILANINGSAQKQGRQIPTTILVHAGRELIADLMELAIAGKFMDKAQAPQVTQAAIAVALKAYKQAQASLAQQPQQQPGQPAPAGAQAAAPPQQSQQQPPMMSPPQPGLVNSARGAA